MSNYTAKRRAGGGLLTAQVLNRMVSATLNGGEALDITFELPLNVDQLLADQFSTLPSVEVGAGISQTSATVINVDFGTDISTQTSVDLLANSGAFTSPDNVAIT